MNPQGHEIILTGSRRTGLRPPVGWIEWFHGLDPPDSHHRRRPCGLRGRLAGGARGLRGRALRDAPGAPDAGAQDGPTRRAGVQQFAQDRAGRLGPLAAQAGAAAPGFAADRIAAEARVPGGHALAVDREVFAGEVTAPSTPSPPSRSGAKKSRHSRRHRGDRHRPADQRRSGADIARLTGADGLFFYDAISPIVDAETVDMSIAFRASRYGKSLERAATTSIARSTGSSTSVRRRAAGRRSASAHIPGDVPYFEAACPSRSWRAAGATRCASAR